MRLRSVVSPKKFGGAIFWSAAVHLSIAAGVIVTGLVGGGSNQVVEETYLDLGYEMYDAPPEIQEKPSLGRTVAEVQPEVKNEIKEEGVRELHDESSNIQGTQETKEASSSGVGSSGVAAAPYYKIKPRYPRSALLSGDEGWVLFSVDVTESGEVENVRVVDGEKKDVFQLEARRAVSRWKYRPFIDGSGNPVRKRDHLVRVEFKLEDQESI